MALINCPECEALVSDKAFQCPKCAYPLQTSKIASEQGSVIGTMTTVIAVQKKSEEISFVLTFLFGVWGLLYGNPKKFTLMLLVTAGALLAARLLVDDLSTFYSVALVIGIVSYIVSVILGKQGVNEYNETLYETDSDKMLAMKQNPDIVDTIRKIIKKEKYLLFYEPSQADELKKYLEEVCTDKEKTQGLIAEYHNRFNRNLSEDLQSLPYTSDREACGTIINQFHCLK